MWPQKPSFSDEWFKISATIFKQKCKKREKQVIYYDKQCQETKQSLCEVKRCPSTQCSDREPVKPVMVNKDMWSTEAAVYSNTGNMQSDP